MLSKYRLKKRNGLCKTVRSDVMWQELADDKFLKWKHL